MAGGNDFFSEVGKAWKSGDSKPTKPRPDVLKSRANNLGEMAAGKRINVQLLKVDPASCKMWANHNRRYDLLNEDRCADLIESIKSQGKQEIPAIVRKCDDPDFDYEVICGARRHFAISWLRNNNYPNFDYLIDVQSITDEEAFRISDVENRAKQDISDYERALDYLRALDSYYPSQTAMAKRLEVSQPWLSRYLDLARLDQKIVAAFVPMTDLKVTHASALKPLLSDRKRASKILEAAEAVGVEQNERAENGLPGVAAKDVLKRLKEAVRVGRKPAQKDVQNYVGSNGKLALQVKRLPKGGLEFIWLRQNADKTEILALLSRVIEEY